MVEPEPKATEQTQAALQAMVPTQMAMATGGREDPADLTPMATVVPQAMAPMQTAARVARATGTAKHRPDNLADSGLKVASVAAAS